ncbi:MAG: hypothetical protein HY021_13950, partial [Burkholderiales bacterium]|nr:hypothetical protein [Burkholderiales bacterium]
MPIHPVADTALAESRADTFFAWTVTGPPTDHARIRVVDQDAPEVRDSSRADFRIEPAPPDTTPQDTTPAPPKFALERIRPNPLHGALE